LWLKSAVGTYLELAGGGIADEDRHPTRAQEFSDGIEKQIQGAVQIGLRTEGLGKIPQDLPNP
jgi:hypothetical protein